MIEIEQSSMKLKTQNYSQSTQMNQLNLKFTVKLISQVKLVIFIEAFVEKEWMLDDSEMMKFDQYFDVCWHCEMYTNWAEDWAAKWDKIVEYDSCEAVLSSVKWSVASSFVTLENEINWKKLKKLIKHWFSTTETESFNI